MTLLLLYFGILIAGVVGYLYAAQGSRQGGDGLSGFIPFWLSAIVIMTDVAGVLTSMALRMARLNNYDGVIVAAPLVIGLVLFFGFLCVYSLGKLLTPSKHTRMYKIGQRKLQQ